MMKQPGKKQESVADHFRIDQSLVSMYLKTKHKSQRAQQMITRKNCLRDKSAKHLRYLSSILSEV